MTSCCYHIAKKVWIKYLKYSQLFVIKINTDKTKFNKSGKIIRKPFYYRGNLLETVKSYKYLGFTITPSGEITSGLTDLRARALKAWYKVKNKLGVHLTNTPIKLM